MASTKPPKAVDSPRPPTKDDSLLAKSARGASLLIILQVASRGLTFAVNQILLRFLSPQLLAISTQLEVYSITVILFSRESLRIALQRQPDSTTSTETQSAIEATKTKQLDSRSPAGKSQTLVNLSYISILLGIFFASAGIYLWTPELLVKETPYFNEALIMYGIATIWELLAEPCFVVVQQNSEFGIRARAESVATFLRCIVTCASAAIAAHLGHDVGVLPFAIGQWVYAVILPIVYYWRTWGISKKGGFSLFMKRIYSVNKSEFLFGYFSTPLLWLGCTLFAQSVIKHFLTQGDTLLISYLASLESQGQFALASNYGGLIARLVFQPIEESSRSYFGKVLSTPQIQDSIQAPGTGDVGMVKGDGKGKGEEAKPSPQAVQTATHHLHHLLRLYTLLALLTTTTLPTLLPLLLTLLTTKSNPSNPSTSPWTNPSTLSTLTTYTYLIPLLSLNGLLESFVTSTATPSTLSWQTAFYTIFSGVYIALAYVFLKMWRMGARGIVWANCVNMGVRILWSAWWVDGWLRKNGSGETELVEKEKVKVKEEKGEKEVKGLDIASLIPKPLVLASWMGTMAILAQMRGAEVQGVRGLFVFLQSGKITAELVELVKVGLVMAGFVIILAFSEKELLLNAYRSIRSR